MQLAVAGRLRDAKTLRFNMIKVTGERGVVTRRVLLKLVGGYAGATMTSYPSTAAFAEIPNDVDFTALSRILLGKQDLSRELGSALLAAFRKNDHSFDQKLAQLRQIIGDAPINGDTLKAKLSGASADLIGLPQSILTGWYLGIVGSGENAICVAYVDALANRAVADVLRPQSYSYGAYGSWASKPA